MTDGRTAAHGQASYDVRLEWGPTGGAAVARGADVAVVVDVLSFTSALTIAVGRGTRVYPFAWKDDRAAAFAEERGAALAVGRVEVAGLPAESAPPSLSPARLLASEPVERLVLPSPNGSTICAALADAGPVVVGGSLRNRAAVARWLAPRVAHGQRVAFVAAGERWRDGSLRPGLEDLWGAGAVLATLQAALGAAAFSPEAEHAAASYGLVAERVRESLLACASGRELVAAGFADDVVAAADVDADAVVPVLTGEGFTAG